MYGAILSYFLKLKHERFYWFFSNQKVKTFILLGLLMSYTILVLFQSFSTIYNWVFFRSIFGILSAGLIGLLVIGFNGKTKLLFEHSWLIKGGQLSYAIYLIHNFVPGLLLGVKKLGLPTIVEFTLNLIVTILISIVLHKLIEIPFRKIGRRLSRITIVKT